MWPPVSWRVGFAGQGCCQQLVSSVGPSLWDLLDPSSLLDPCWILAGTFQAGLALSLRLLRKIALEGCIFWRMGSASGRGFWGQPGAELGVRLLTRLSQALALGSSRGQAGSGC